MLTALLMAILAILTPVVVDAAPAADTTAVMAVVVDAAPAADTTAVPAFEVDTVYGVLPPNPPREMRKKASSRALYGPAPKELGVSKRRVRKGKASVMHSDFWVTWGINPLGQVFREIMVLQVLARLAKNAICLGLVALVAFACIYGANVGDTIQNAASAVFTVNAVKFGEGESAGKTARLRIKVYCLEMVDFAVALAGKLGYSIKRDEYTSDLKSKGRGSQRMADTVGIERELLSVHFKGHLLDGLRLQAGELEKALAQFPEPLSSLVVEAGVKPEEPIHIRQKAWPETLSAAGFVMTNASKVMKRLGSLWATPTETFEKIDVVINPLWTGAKHDGDALMEDPSVEPGTCYFAQFRVYTDEGMIKGFCMVVHGPKRKLVSGPENLKSGLNCSRRFGFLMDRIVAERALQVAGENPSKGHATASWMLFVQMIWTPELISYFKELIKWSADGAYHRMRWAIQNGTILELLGSAEDPEDNNEGYEESEPGQTRIDRDIVLRRMKEAGVSTRGFLCLMTLITNVLKGWSKPYYEGFDKKTGIFALANTLKKMGALLSYSCRGKFYSLPYFIQGMGWERVKAAVLQQEKGIEKISFNKERGCIVASSTNKKTGNLYTWEIHMLQTDLIEGMPRGVFLVSDDFAVDILKLLGGADKDGDEGSAVKTKGKGRGWGSSKNGGFEEKELTNPTLLFRHPIGSGEGILIESKSLMVRYKALKKTIGTNSKGKRVQRPIPPMPTPEFRNFEIIECPEELQDTYDNKPWSNEHTKNLLEKRFASDPLGEKINCNLAQFLYAKNPRCFGAEATVDGYQQETTKAEFFAWAAMKAFESSTTVMRDGISPAGTIRFGLDPEDCTILKGSHFFDELSQFKAETFEEYRDQLVEEFTSPKGLIEGRLEEFERLLGKSKRLAWMTDAFDTAMVNYKEALAEDLLAGKGWKAIANFMTGAKRFVANYLPGHIDAIGKEYKPEMGTICLWIALNKAAIIAKSVGKQDVAYGNAMQILNDLRLPNAPASGGFDDTHPLPGAFEWLMSADVDPEDPNPEGDGPQDDGPDDLPIDIRPDTEDLPQEQEPDTDDSIEMCAGDKLTAVMGPFGELLTVDELADYSDTSSSGFVSDDAPTPPNGGGDGPEEIIPGLTLQENFVSEDEERQLVKDIDGGSWDKRMKRWVQHFGYAYDYRNRSVTKESYLGPLPGWSTTVVDRVTDLLGGTRPDQIIVNEYKGNQGIAAHIDCEPCFTDKIVSVSLLEAVFIVFRNKTTGEVKQVLLPARSCLVMSGEARYEWTHEIQTGRLGPDGTPRQRRLSLTLRNVIIDSDDAPTPPPAPEKEPEVNSANPLVAAGVKPEDKGGHCAKDIAMAEMATQFIGTEAANSSNSSTKRYRLAWGDRANTNCHRTDDIVMVSGSGNWGRVTIEDCKKVFIEHYVMHLMAACIAKCKFVVGNASGVDRMVRAFLVSQGYIEQRRDGFGLFSLRTMFDPKDSDVVADIDDHRNEGVEDEVVINEGSDSDHHGLEDSEPVEDEKTSPPEATPEELIEEFFQDALLMQKAQGLGIPQDQYDALKGIVLGFLAGKKELILNGAAGCGKTFLVKLIVDCLRHVAKGGHRVFNSVDLCSFTGTAQLNLRKATGMDACTIHTLIGVEDVQGHLCLKKEVEPAYRALIINDEATMTSPLLGQKLRKLASGQGSAILWVGDMAQLPPVLPEFKGKEINRWLHDREVGPTGPAPIMESGIERFHLTTNFRQAKGGTILAIAKIFRSIFMAGWDDEDSTKNGRTSWVIQGDDEAGRVITNLINGSDQVERGTIDIERLVEDPGNNAAIFPTNRMADGTNGQCVNYLGCKSTTQDPIPVGATMMVSTNKLAHCEYIEDGVVAGVDPLYLANGSRVKVVAVENHGALNPGDEWRTYNCLQLDVVEINGDGKVWRIYTDVNFDNKYQEFFQAVNPLVLTSWSRLYNWNPDLSEEVVEKRVTCSFKMKYGWAMTVHKSQGLGFDRIYTTADVLYGKYSNMQMGHNINLSYTAITRAKAKIILV